MIRETVVKAAAPGADVEASKRVLITGDGLFTYNMARALSDLATG